MGKREEGQALVEFALVATLLLLLLFGAIEFGRVFHAYHVITSAAREGARAAAVGKNNATIEQKIEGAVESLVSDDSKVEEKKTKAEYISAKPNENQIFFYIQPYDYTVRTNGTTVQTDVYVKGAVRLFVPLIEVFFSENPKIIKTEAQMRIE